MNAAEELMFLRNHRVQLVTVITKLTNRYIATEYDGTDVRKAAELDVELDRIKTELANVDRCIQLLTRAQRQDTLQTSSSVTSSVRSTTMTTMSPPQYDDLTQQQQQQLTTSSRGALSPSSTPAATLHPRDLSSVVVPASADTASSVRLSVSPPPTLTSSSSSATTTTQHGLPVARAFGAIINPAQLSHDDLLEIMRRAEQRDVDLNRTSPASSLKKSSSLAVSSATASSVSNATTASRLAPSSSSSKRTSLPFFNRNEARAKLQNAANDAAAANAGTSETPEESLSTPTSPGRPNASSGAGGALSANSTLNSSSLPPLKSLSKSPPTFAAPTPPISMSTGKLRHAVASTDANDLDARGAAVMLQRLFAAMPKQKVTSRWYVDIDHAIATVANATRTLALSTSLNSTSTKLADITNAAAAARAVLATDRSATLSEAAAQSIGAVVSACNRCFDPHRAEPLEVSPLQVQRALETANELRRSALVPFETLRILRGLLDDDPAVTSSDHLSPSEPPKSDLMKKRSDLVRGTVSEVDLVVSRSNALALKGRSESARTLNATTSTGLSGVNTAGGGGGNGTAGVRDLSKSALVNTLARSDGLSRAAIASGATTTTGSSTSFVAGALSPPPPPSTTTNSSSATAAVASSSLAIVSNTLPTSLTPLDTSAKRFASKERMIKRASWSSETSSMLRAFILGQDDTDKRNNKHSADFDHQFEVDESDSSPITATNNVMNIDRNMDSIDSNNAYNSISSSSIATNNNNNNNVNNINTSSNSNNFNNNNNSNNISNIGNVRGNAIDDSVVNSRKSYQANASEEDADEYGEGGVATNEANIRRASHEQPSSLVRSDINDLRGARVPGARLHRQVALVNFDNDPVEFLDELGRGGSAIVYRAMLGHFSVACKVFYPTTEEERNIIKREILVLERLTHPHIVHQFAHDFSREERIFCYLELFSCTLYNLIRERRSAPDRPASRRRFAPTEIISALTQIALGVEYLHSQIPPIVHRDLKSDNVFAHRRVNAFPVLKIGDFGEARRLPRSERKRLSGNVGTIEFRAPEVIVTQVTSQSRKGIAYDERVDVWGIGMILFEILAMEIPYRLEKINPFVLPGHIARGVRPRLPNYVVPDGVVVSDDNNEDDTNDEFSGNAVAAVNHLEYGAFVELFELCAEFLPRDRPSAKELVKRLRHLEQLLKLQAPHEGLWRKLKIDKKN